MLIKQIIAEGIGHPRWLWKDNMLSQKEHKAWTIFNALRFVAIVVAVIQIYVFAVPSYSVFHPTLLVVLASVYTFFEAMLPARWYRKGHPILILLITDMAAGAFLILFTGGLYSPFLLFTLSAVLRAGLFLEAGITSATAAILVINVIIIHVFNPFFNRDLSDSGLSFLFIFIAAVSLSAVLPYLINVNLRQRLKTQDVLEERQKLSHEIHDGLAQNVTALRWQIQLLQRRLATMGIELTEARELEKLVEKAQYETRESLELLRNYHGQGSLLLYLKDYRKYFKQEPGIHFSLDIDSSRTHLETAVEVEVLRICQEALANVRKHSNAKKVHIAIRPEKGKLKVTIVDDGSGFDPNAVFKGNGFSKSHGLSIMRERAESIGAAFEVLSAPGKGVEIRLELPNGGHWN
jgi:signal transduction histidine kinase